MVDNATTHNILKNRKYFFQLIIDENYVNTIFNSIKLIECSKRANINLPKGTQISINDALLSTKSQRNLLNFKGIWQNKYHIEIVNKKDIEYLYITTVVASKKTVL